MRTQTAVDPTPDAFAFSSCPVPLPVGSEITIGHGGGGRLTQDLINRIFRPAFDTDSLEAQHDAALLDFPAGRLAFSTDSHVVSPLFFPGGDIGGLAINGTVNDLCMTGARPLWLSAGFILEEGLAIDTLERVVQSMKRAADAAGVGIVAGDTKVVERGRCDGLYITTSGIGVVETPRTIAPTELREGDAVVLSGDLGRHGMAIMATRAGLSFESPIESDCAPLVKPVKALLEAGLEIHCLRDLTRGGLATSLVELAESSGLSIAIDAVRIPVPEAVNGACEILGLDPLYVANEGRFVCILPEGEAERALKILTDTAPGKSPAIIGRVGSGPAGQVTQRSVIGAERIVDRLSGEQLPRIC
ncbi:hydrogenase expression/formation protein HypE [Haloferula sp. A504]|uniref:hydrogenase expression/formation protein HypE n=1 Tax=Haloferula sp. A504 TaxID=3373601 RepID=UPI0031C32051|nr:hydrogenase expression/formation protein HypE [Verrucomicrobiaceae bacterium E54]